MSIDRFIGRNRIACVFLALHSLLIGAYAWIELNHAWNDMNPTMLVMAAAHIADYPIHVALQPFIGNGQQLGTYLAATLIFGGAFWFAIGWCISRVFHAGWQWIVRKQTIGMGA